MSERQISGSIDTDALEARLTGSVLLPGGDGYDEARTVWNAMVDRRPAVVVRCANRDDVVAAIRFARDNDLEIGVRCGGHSVLGTSVPDGGLMIDLTPMRAVSVDPAARRARIQGGALLGVLDRAAQEHGLATTAGNVSHTGVGGLTLGGGMGWLARQYGLSCDNVEAYELVTADGAVLRVTADEHPDLFWGLRGGGGNFGVVTEFEFRLHETGTTALVADIYYPAEQAFEAFQRWRDVIPEAPRRATMTAWVGTPVDWPHLPPEVSGTPMASIGYVWIGDPSEGRALLDDLRAGTPAAMRAVAMPYVELQTMDDTPEGHAFRRYWKGHYLRELPDAAIEAFLARGAADGPASAGHARLPGAGMQAYGGAIADVPDSDSAFSQRDAVVEFVAAARWTDPAADDEMIGAARRFGAAVEPFASGAYVNALADEGQAGVERAYRPDRLARLVALKDRYDPENVFHLNHNITPTASRA